MAVSPLGLRYRFRPGVGLESALDEECKTYVGDHDFLWRASRVPSIQLAASVPGELEAIIAARDAAATEAINAAYKDLASKQTSTEPEFAEALNKNRTELYVRFEPELVGVVDIGRL